MTLPPQLHLNPDPLSPARVEPIRPNPRRLDYEEQPDGGLWTATYDPVSGSPFARHVATYIMGSHLWAEAWPGGAAAAPMDVTTDYYGWVLTPDPAARVFEVATYADCSSLFARFARWEAGAPARRLDWPAIAREYDAVHLTAAAASQEWAHIDATRNGQMAHLAGWLHESTIWFRWCFQSVEALGLTTGRWGYPLPPPAPDWRIAASLKTQPPQYLQNRLRHLYHRAWHVARPEDGVELIAYCRQIAAAGPGAAREALITRYQAFCDWVIWDAQRRASGGERRFSEARPSFAAAPEYR